MKLDAIAVAEAVRNGWEPQKRDGTEWSLRRNGCLASIMESRHLLDDGSDWFWIVVSPDANHSVCNVADLFLDATKAAEAAIDNLTRVGCR